MYVLRRVWETQPGQARLAATIAAKMGQAYTDAGQRGPVQVSFNGGTMPGETNRVYMTWTQESLESPYRAGLDLPAEAIRDLGPRLRELTVGNWLEVTELLTPDKYQEE